MPKYKNEVMALPELVNQMKDTKTKKYMDLLMTFQKKLGISQASSFGISLVGPTLGPCLRLEYLFKVLPSDHVFKKSITSFCLKA